MNNIERLQNIFKELKKDDEEGHSSAYELQWEDIETIENLIKENKELKDKSKKIKTEIEEKMKYLWVDSCAEDSGKYSAYRHILNILEE